MSNMRMYGMALLAAGLMIAVTGCGNTGATAQSPHGQAVSPATPSTQPGIVLKDPKEMESYCLGVMTARNYKLLGVDFDPDIMIRGMKDVKAGDKLLLPEATVQSILVNFNAQQRVTLTKARLAAADDNKREGEAFLAANKDKEGVVTLPSGLQYKILKGGDGKTPTDDEKVVYMYRGTLVNGTEFDSSNRIGKPAVTKVSEPTLIAGFKEALKLMSAGARWQIFIPSQLAYGPRGFGRDIGPNATLIYEVEVISIRGDDASAKNSAETQPKE
jgi:FKBP-type peptidyl-prolyl cis-trans isomerase